MNKYMFLRNGNKIPTLAYGTWLIDNAVAAECVKNAIEVGYRHIDTAQAYRNEEGVGKGIKLSGIKREELFVTTKVMAEIKSYKEAKKSIDESLKRLDLDYVDLLLIHCPQPWAEFRGPKRYFEENRAVWKALEEAYKEGKAKAIGVSNFLIDDIENISKDCEIEPMANQVLCHIGKTPVELIDYCKAHDIVFESYSPIAHGRAFNDDKIKLMAEKYGVSIPRLCIQYTLQLDTVSIPKATSREHIEDNFNLNFKIKEEDMKELLKDNNFNYAED